jgi:hypothetical protein
VLFHHYKEELDFNFIIIWPPQMLIVLADLQLVLSSATYYKVEKGLLGKVLDGIQEVVMTPDDSACSMGGPFSNPK